MATATFRLSGRFQDFKWIGETMSLATTSPVVARVEIIADTVKGRDGVEQQAAKATAEFESPISDELAERLKDVGPGEIFFHYFPVQPVNVQAELKGIRSLLADATGDALNLVRWSLGELGPSDPLVNVSFSVSTTAGEWHEIGPEMLYRPSRSYPHALTPDWQQALQGQLDNSEREPIARAMLREAWSSRFTNPRSALVLSVASLEVGTKECISRLVPESTWLVDNVPSPPVHSLLTNYLPELLLVRGNLSLFAPTKTPLKRVQEAVEHRNVFVHRFVATEKYAKAEKALEYLELEKTLSMVQEFLNLFDLYTGKASSLNLIGSETQQEMINRNCGQELPAPEYTPA